jgi:hypothetical protein
MCVHKNKNMSVFGVKPDRFIFHGGSVVATETKDGWTLIAGVKRTRPDFTVDPYDITPPPNKYRRLNPEEREQLRRIRRPVGADFREQFLEQTMRAFGRNTDASPSGGEPELK